MLQETQNPLSSLKSSIRPLKYSVVKSATQIYTQLIATQTEWISERRSCNPPFNRSFT